MIDFKYMVEINVLNPLLQRKITRSMSTASRIRPGENTRWVDASAWKKPTLKEGVPNWLGETWEKEMKKKEGLDEYAYRLPSVFEIMTGIQAEEKKNQLELHLDHKIKK